MKKKKILIAVVMILSIFLGNLGRITAYADEDPVKSKGNFVLDNGEMAIYASDMDYLQSELGTLYSELPSIIGDDATSTGKIRRNSIQSKGILNYRNGTVLLNSSDFTFLADEIDGLEVEYKSNTVAVLNDISTYFKLDGSITHNQEEENLSSQNAAMLSFDTICGGILQSQSVEHLANVQAKDFDGNPLYYTDENASANKDLIMNTTNVNSYPILIQPATPNNLTAGTAAWVDGKLIIGNSADNSVYYDKGKEDTTLLKKIISLFYNHSEKEMRFALNDVTGNGYTTVINTASGTEVNGKYLTLQSDKIPLYDLSDPEHPKLLYKVEFTYNGRCHIPVEPCEGRALGSTILQDQNGNQIDSVSTGRVKNETTSTVTIEFILPNYVTDTDYVYLDVTSQVVGTGYGINVIIYNTFPTEVNAIYYADPE